MTPQEKAQSIFNDMYESISFYGQSSIEKSQDAKKCAIIAVDEILAMCPEMAELYWQEVKNHLNQM